MTFRFSHEPVSFNNDSVCQTKYSALQDRPIHHQDHGEPGTPDTFEGWHKLRNPHHSPFALCSFPTRRSWKPQDVEKHKQNAEKHSPSAFQSNSYSTTLSTSLSSKLRTMPTPSTSRLKGKEPPCGCLPPKINVRRSSPPSPLMDFYNSSTPPINGASTRAQLKERFSTSATSWPSTTMASRRGLQTASIHRTPRGHPEQLALRVDTSPSSIPVSPNYFDPLSEEVEEAMEVGANPGPPSPNPPTLQPRQQHQ